MGGDRAIAHQQVVVDLHDDEALGWQRGSRLQRHDVLAMARGPRAQPGHLEELDQSLAEDRRFTEAGPSLATVVGGPGLSGQ